MLYKNCTEIVKSTIYQYFT